MSRWLSILSRVLNGIGSYVVLPVLTLLITADVILRYLFNAPLGWGLEASQHILLLFFMFGLLESFRVGEHVGMDLLASRFSPLATRLVSLLQALLLVLVFCLIIVKVIDEIPFLYSLPQVTPELQLRVWMFYAFIGAVCVIIIIYVLHAAHCILLGRRSKIEEADQAPWME